MGDMDNHENTPTGVPKPAREELFQQDMEKILVKLKNNPSAITTEDARRLSENVEARDEKSARIISAVESFAVANEALNEQDASLGQAPHTSLLTVVKDLHAAVETSPGDVTTEILRTAQSAVSKMQKAVGHTNVPHPELEAELQEEVAKIEPKVARGTVTKAEANHLHSLEDRAHGHTEKGGIAAAAQSLVAKRERQMSLINPQEQSYHDKEANLQQTEATIKPKLEQGTITQVEVDLLQSRETGAHGHIDKGGLVATAQSLISKKRQESLSDRSNVSPRASEADYERRKEQSYLDKENNLKIAEVSIEPNIEGENVSKDDTAYVQSCEHRAYGYVDKGGVAAETLSKTHKRENSQPIAENSHWK